MQVIRIEHIKTGEGIWGEHMKLIDILKIRTIYKRHNSSLFPGPFQDLIIRDKFIMDLHYFGFNDIYKFNKAFTKRELSLLIKHGFRVYVLELDKYIQSEYQTIFELKDVKSKIDITNIFK